MFMCVVNLKSVNKLDLTWKQSFLIDCWYNSAGLSLPYKQILVNLVAELSYQKRDILLSWRFLRMQLYLLLLYIKLI